MHKYIYMIKHNIHTYVIIRGYSISTLEILAESEIRSLTNVPYQLVSESRGCVDLEGGRTQKIKVQYGKQEAIWSFCRSVLSLSMF